MKERLRVRDLDFAAGFDLASQLEEQRGDLGATIEVGFDSAQHAAVLPECALLSRAAVRVTCGDELDRAERAVTLGRHVAIVPRRWLTAIRRLHVARLREATDFPGQRLWTN